MKRRIDPGHNDPGRRYLNDRQRRCEVVAAAGLIDLAAAVRLDEPALRRLRSSPTSYGHLVRRTSVPGYIGTWGGMVEAGLDPETGVPVP